MDQTNPFLVGLGTLGFGHRFARYAHDHEIAAMKNLLPGEADPNAAGVAQSQDKMLKVQFGTDLVFIWF